MSKIFTHQEQELEQRRQKVLAVARHCITILKQEFGAKKVILFGSILVKIKQAIAIFDEWLDEQQI